MHHGPAYSSKHAHSRWHCSNTPSLLHQATCNSRWDRFAAALAAGPLPPLLLLLDQSFIPKLHQLILIEDQIMIGIPCSPQPLSLTCSLTSFVSCTAQRGHPTPAPPHEPGHPTPVCPASSQPPLQLLPQVLHCHPPAPQRPCPPSSPSSAAAYVQCCLPQWQTWTPPGITPSHNRCRHNMTLTRGTGMRCTGHAEQQQCTSAVKTKPMITYIPLHN